jgi:hypothetical protein
VRLDGRLFSLYVKIVDEIGRAVSGKLLTKKVRLKQIGWDRQEERAYEDHHRGLILHLIIIISYGGEHAKSHTIPKHEIEFPRGVIALTSQHKIKSSLGWRGSSPKYNLRSHHSKCPLI